jgi:DinB family protein
LSILPVSLVVAAEEKNMSTTVTSNKDLDQARQYFALTHSRIVETTTGLSDAQFRFKPAPVDGNARWSIAEILEHLVIVHQRILTRVAEQLPAAPAPPPDRDSRLLDSIVMEKIPDRSFKVKAPEFIQPTGRMSPAEALAAIARDYQRLETFLKSTPDLRGHIIESAPMRVVTNGAYDTMDGYQFALATAAHDQRHVRQIEEVKQDPNYPA